MKEMAIWQIFVLIPSTERKKQNDSLIPYNIIYYDEGLSERK